MHPDTIAWTHRTTDLARNRDTGRADKALCVKRSRGIGCSSSVLCCAVFEVSATYSARVSVR